DWSSDVCSSDLEDEAEARSCGNGSRLGQGEVEVRVHIRDEERRTGDREGGGHLREDTDDEDHPGLEARAARRHGSRLAPTVRRQQRVSDRGVAGLPIQLFWIVPL